MPEKKSVNELLGEFSQHLKWLISRHAHGKNYSEEFLIQHCFSRKSTFTKNEARQFCRAHLIVADKLFDLLLSDMKGGGSVISRKEISKHKEIIKNYIFDLKMIAEWLERQKDPKYIFLNGQKTYGLLTFEVYRFSCQLAFSSTRRNSKLHLDHRAAQICAIFSLRQALEVRFQRIIAVDLVNKYGDTPKLRHDFHYDFIARNPTYFNFRSIEFKNLKKLYDWCNEIVHKMYHPTAWQIEYALTIAGKLFNSLPPATPQSGWSIHNAVEINNLSKMQQDFVTHFNRWYEHDFWSVTFAKPEAIIV